jgi:2,4-diketo-3-deoxy-L-fuconate hydrolase
MISFEREFQLEHGGQWFKGKSCDTFGPIGPWLVTRDEVSNPANLNLWLEVNGNRFQNRSTATMVFGVAHLVSYISRYVILMPRRPHQHGDATRSGIGAETATVPPIRGCDGARN